MYFQCQHCNDNYIQAVSSSRQYSSKIVIVARGRTDSTIHRDCVYLVAENVRRMPQPCQAKLFPRLDSGYGGNQAKLPSAHDNEEPRPPMCRRCLCCWRESCSNVIGESSLCGRRSTYQHHSKGSANCYHALASNMRDHWQDCKDARIMARHVFAVHR